MTPQTTRIREVRTGGLDLIGQSGIRSGIAKSPRLDAVQVTFQGLDGDRQAETFHGGAEKAVLHYDARHYAFWRAEFPSLAGNFRPGGFGENLVTYDAFSEAEVCIGDVLRAGGALLQVSEPRQPCFKLNQRFGDKGIASRAQETGRTGWLYRVLEPGTLRGGDLITLIDRPLPDWSVERLQRYLYHLTDDLDVAAILAELPHLSEGFRTLFARRLSEGRAEDWSARLSNGPLSHRKGDWFEADILGVDDLSPDIRAYTLGRTDGQPLPRPTGGAHIEVKVENALTRAYSLIPAETGRWRIAVRRVEDGRGGSVAIHRGWKPGMRIVTSAQRSHFPLMSAGQHHHFLAAGIGITPFLTLIDECEAAGQDWHLTWLVRKADTLPFPALLARHPRRITLHATEGWPGRRFDPRRDLPCLSEGQHLYCCGPDSLMRAVQDITRHWPPGHAHFEVFQPAARTDSDSFVVTIEGQDGAIAVGADETLLEALRRSGHSVRSECETGSCGTCVLSVRSGRVDHRDFCLSATARGNRMAACVSRGKGHIHLAPLVEPAG